MLSGIVLPGSSIEEYHYPCVLERLSSEALDDVPGVTSNKGQTWSYAQLSGFEIPSLLNDLVDAQFKSADGSE